VGLRDGAEPRNQRHGHDGEENDNGDAPRKKIKREKRCILLRFHQFVVPACLGPPDNFFISPTKIPGLMTEHFNRRDGKNDREKKRQRLRGDRAEKANSTV